jgi:hypothetical protein
MTLSVEPRPGPGPRARRALAERLRTPWVAPEGTGGEVSMMKQHQLTAAGAKLAEVCQRSRAHEGRNGERSLRHHQLRGLAHPRARA